MGCIEKGDLRAFLDEELSHERAVQVEQHLASCGSCRRELDSLRSNATFARSALDDLSPVSAEVRRPEWSRIRASVDQRNSVPVTPGLGITEMLTNVARLFGGSKMRWASSTMAVLVMVALLFTLSPVQTMASSFLSIFRVKKFAAITVDPSTLPNLGSPKDLGAFTTSGSPTPRQVSLDAASKTVGFAVQLPSALPAGLDPQPRTTVTDAYSMSFTPDLAKVRAYLSSIGASNVKLPDNLDGATITANMPPSVSVLYLEKGGAARSEDGTIMPHVGQKFLFLGMTTSPTMDIPSGIDVDQVRSELLKVPGLPPDLVNQVKAIDDWRNTMVVPVVKGTSKDVKVQGEDGLLVTSPEGQGSHLVWQKNGVIYAMSGSVSETEMLAAANSIK